MKGFGKGLKLQMGEVSSTIEVEITPQMLREMAGCLIKAFVKEAKKDFAKRGWSGTAEDGSKPIWDSFTYEINRQTIVVLSSYPFVAEMVSAEPKKRKMTWLTQEAKDKFPSNYRLTPTERRKGQKRAGRLSKKERMPLVVPVKSGGNVVFRMAPLKMADAWIHPGIARFTFIERAIKAGKADCLRFLGKQALSALVRDLST